MPSANKAKGVFDSGKTYSYHIKSVVTCLQSSKTSASFKLVFRRDGGDKSYDFEAESVKAASTYSAQNFKLFHTYTSKAEIVTSVRSIKAGLDRASIVGKSRRSRHVG